MKDQIKNAKEWLLTQNIDGVLTGSTMLGYFDDKQDIDIFCYSEQSFTKLIYALYHNPMFLILDPVEKWKFKEFTENPYRKNSKKIGLITLKFKYNLCIDINIIFKENCKNIFDVLSTFDMDIIAKGIDLKTKEVLDLSRNNGKMIATWNRWNPKFYSTNLWTLNQLLRQFDRVVKYYKRGFNTDEIVHKYIEIINNVIEYENIFNSQKIDDKINSVKENAEIILKIFNIWLNTHEFTEENQELLKIIIKEM